MEWEQVAFDPVYQESLNPLNDLHAAPAPSTPRLGSGQFLRPELGGAETSLRQERTGPLQDDGRPAEVSVLVSRCTQNFRNRPCLVPMDGFAVTTAPQLRKKELV